MASKITNPKSSQDYQINKSLLSLPGYIYWKNSEGYFLGSNDNFINLTNDQDLQGKSDASFSWGNDCKLFRNNDQCVLNNGKPFVFIEPTRLANNQILYLLSVKSPLITKHGTVTGTFGVSISVEEKTFNEFFQEMLTITRALKLILEPELIVRFITQTMHLYASQKEAKLENRLFDYGHVVFSFREAQCLHYFLNHYSAQKTSEKLFISQKTVEFHLAKIKEKLNCYATSQITQLAVDYGFIDLMFMGF